jgi:carbon monoxide dehydrogenase subunit G
MKITGSATLHGPRDRVWQVLNDPEVLVRTIPGCQELRANGQDSYRMTLTAGVASIKGTYQGSVSLTEQQPPGSFLLHAAGAGGPGTVDAKVKVSLSEEGEQETRLDYDADAVVGGMIGGVGQRVLTGVAKKTAGEFVAAVDGVLTGRVPADGGVGVAPAAPGGAAVPGASALAGEGPPATAGVYRAPAAAAGPLARVPGPDFAKGAVFGAAVALLGVVVGAIVGRRR